MNQMRVLCVLTFSILCCSKVVLGQQQQYEVEVEVEDFWGTLSVEAGGDPFPLKCLAEVTKNDIGEEEGEEGTGEFMWVVGDQILPNSLGSEPKKVGENQWRQEFLYSPNIDHDGKSLSCKYVIRDIFGGVITEEEDKVMLSVTMLELPTEVDAGVYREGNKAMLSVEFSMYPPPLAENIFWVVSGGEDGSMTEIKTGYRELVYSVPALESLGDYQWRSTLEIDNVQPGEEDKTHVMVVTRKDVNDVSRKRQFRVPVKFTVKSSSSPPPSPSPSPSTKPSSPAGEDGAKPSPDSEEEEDKEKSEEDLEKAKKMLEHEEEVEKQQAQMGVGLFVIIAIIVLVLMVCVGYCVYQKCCKNKNAGNTSAKNSSAAANSRNASTAKYTPAATEDRNPA